jgi:hypothetical protein
VAGVQAGDSPMDRFRKLARRLAKVPKRELDELRAAKPKPTRRPSKSTESGVT